jgi:hypothetical protein
MKPRSSAALLANPFVLWSTLGMKTMQMSAAAAQVIAIRTTRMAIAGMNPTATDRRENSRMVTEKVDAFSRAGHALATGAAPLVAGMAGQAMRTGWDLFNAATGLAASRSLPQTMLQQRKLADTLMRYAPVLHHHAASAATARLAHKALAPVHRKATANHKRLTTRQAR